MKQLEKFVFIFLFHFILFLSVMVFKLNKNGFAKTFSYP